MYTQNKEEKYITEYFEGKSGIVLSIGENDGKTFSNALRLIELGWLGVLVEPSPSAFEKLQKLHAKNNVVCVRAAIGPFTGKVTLHESGPHLKDRSDFSLLSTTIPKETEKWKGVDFNPIEVDQLTIPDLIKLVDVTHFDFVSIDAEGMDVEILKQIDLTNTKMVCVEWNEKQSDKEEIIAYCSTFGITKELYVTGENIILAR